MDRDKRAILVLALIAGFWLGCVATVLSQPPPPPVPMNTIEYGEGINMPTVNAWDYFYRDWNVTAFFEAVANWLENNTLPQPVWEETVEWGLVLGQTGDWFNHTLPGEPITIVLQMHPTNITYDDVLVYPVVYDKTGTQWQLGLYWFNGTQLSAVDHPDLLVMYHMRWEPPYGGEPVNPNEPQLPEEPD